MPRPPVAVGLLVSLVAFGLDLLTPLGVAMGVLHAVAIVATIGSRGARDVLLVAAVASALALLGLWLSPSTPTWMVHVNRGIALVAIWVTAGLVVLHSAARRRADAERSRAEAEVRRYAEELETRVAERAARIRELESRRGEVEKLAATARMGARIAHEINNPLAGIRNCLTLLRQPDDLPPSKRTEYLVLADREVERVAHIVRRMIDLHRSDTERPIAVTAERLLADMTTLFAEECRARGVTLEQTASECADVVHLPEGLVRLMLFAVAENAIEVSPRGETVRVIAETRPGLLTVSVEDRGPGIPAELHDRVYEPFFTTKSASGGLGLGLSLCRQAGQAIGAEIELESEIGVGTTVRMRFPASHCA